jgi:ABC-type dipeptide/oligopeptide/nickel transport system permease component
VRKALAQSMDMEEYVRTVAHGLALLPTGFQCYFGPAYDHDVQRLPFDLESARERFAEAGWYDRDGDGVIDKDGQPFELHLMIQSGSKGSEIFARMFQESLAKVGVRLVIAPLDWATYMERLNARDFDAGIGSWAVDVTENDPVQLWHSQSAGRGGSNHAGVIDPHVDELIARGARELDDEKRWATWRELHRYLYEEVQPYLYREMPPRKFALSKAVRGVQFFKVTPATRRAAGSPAGTPGTRPTRWTAYVLRRLGLMVPTLLGITLLSFALLQLVPGDPARAALRHGRAVRRRRARSGGAAAARVPARCAAVEALPALPRALRPLAARRALRRRLGRAHVRRPARARPRDRAPSPHVRVADELGRRLAVTVPLALAALVVAYAVAVPIGVPVRAAAQGPPRAHERAGDVPALQRAGLLAGLLLQLAFGQPASAGCRRWASPSRARIPCSRASSTACCPSCACRSRPPAYLSRQMRAGMLEVAARGLPARGRARAGLPERTVIRSTRCATR